MRPAVVCLDTVIELKHWFMGIQNCQQVVVPLAKFVHSDLLLYVLLA